MIPFVVADANPVPPCGTVKPDIAEPVAAVNLP